MLCKLPGAGSPDISPPPAQIPLLIVDTYWAPSECLLSIACFHFQTEPCLAEFIPGINSTFAQLLWAASIPSCPLSGNSVSSKSSRFIPLPAPTHLCPHHPSAKSEQLLPWPLGSQEPRLSLHFILTLWAEPSSKSRGVSLAPR